VLVCKYLCVHSISSHAFRLPAVYQNLPLIRGRHAGLHTTFQLVLASHVQVLTVTTAAGAEDLAAAHELVTTMSPSARRTYAVGGTQKYELPTAEITLSQVNKDGI